MQKSFQDFINEALLNEAISKEFRELSGPLVLKRFSDFIAGRGISVQNSSFRKLSDQEKANAKRKLSDKKLEELPFGERFLIFVLPYSKKQVDKIKELTKNPGEDYGKSRSKTDPSNYNLGNVWVVDRSSGEMINFKVDAETYFDHFDGDKAIHDKPHVYIKTDNIRSGILAEFRNVVNSNYVAFTFDTNENIKKLKDDRYNNKRFINDPLDPSYPWGKNKLTIQRDKKNATLKNTKGVVLYKDSVKKLSDDYLEELKTVFDNFFKDIDKGNDTTGYVLTKMVNKLEKLRSIFDALASASKYDFGNYADEIKKSIANYKK